MNTTLLELVIRAVEAADSDAFVSSGWDRLQTALAPAKAAMTAQSQSEIDAAAKALNKAWMDVRRKPDASALKNLK
ncbi:hypothetical protein [Allobaculum sp. Allo2]|uniref:hypothetical protein n=1 Tax=Allobaculum sp. Allo2 TaxID=2853432 RepID=UPI001F622197|nr:hypothetical protein [Allobaculum sp. Allo2]UNT94131.1 hypothetical protein KWG61_05710 [Allobaculum sp. Allo2]